MRSRRCAVAWRGWHGCASNSPRVRELICGFHIEGPFLSAQPGYVGAHRPDATCDADRDKLQQLLDAAGGAARVVTLAPERDPAARITPAGRSRRGRRRRTLRSHS